MLVPSKLARLTSATVTEDNVNHTDCSLQLFKCLNHLGVSKGIVATRRNVDIAVREADTKLKEWRTQVLKFASMLRHRYIVHFFSS